MNITLLCENQAGYKEAKNCLSEWGLSFFIQHNGTNILFDAGHTDVYLRNAEQLGIDLHSIDCVVLSHHHWDHTGGLRYWNIDEKKSLYTHPDTMAKLPYDQRLNIEAKFDIQTSTKPIEMADNIIFLAEIPRTNSFEPGCYKSDAMLDDSAIVIKTPKGAVLIVGCAHSGICNICEYAKQVSGLPLYAVIGGFHLSANEPEIVRNTIEYFHAENIQHLYPMHCVDFPTLSKFHSEFSIVKYSTGDIIDID